MARVPKAFGAALLAGALLLAACSQAPGNVPSPAAATAGPMPSKIVIAVQPTSTPEKLSSDAEELKKFLQAEVGVPVELVFPTTYAGVIEALKFGHAQAAFMSAWPMSLATKHASAEVVLAEVREVVIDGKKVEAPYYYSYWVVPKESSVSSLSELKGSKVCFPSPLSTSGYVAPVGRLIELGLLSASPSADPKAFFGSVTFAGGYAQCWEALKKGQVDVTVIAGDVPEALYREVLAATKVIEQQGPVPSHGVVYARNLNEPLRTRLTQGLLKLGEESYRPLMRKFISGIFVRFQPTTADQHLSTLNRYLQATGLAYSETLR